MIVGNQDACSPNGGEAAWSSEVMFFTIPFLNFKNWMVSNLISSLMQIADVNAAARAHPGSQCKWPHFELQKGSCSI